MPVENDPVALCELVVDPQFWPRLKALVEREWPGIQVFQIPETEPEPGDPRVLSYSLALRSYGQASDRESPRATSTASPGN